MSDCCAASACGVEKLRDRPPSTLLLVPWINEALFVMEGTAGILASSTALLANALGLLGDALIYGFSLYVVGGHCILLYDRARKGRSPAHGLRRAAVPIAVARTIDPRFSPRR